MGTARIYEGWVVLGGGDGIEIVTSASSLYFTQDVVSCVQVTPRLAVHKYSVAHPYAKTPINTNNLVI